MCYPRCAIHDVLSTQRLPLTAYLSPPISRQSSLASPLATQVLAKATSRPPLPPGGEQSALAKTLHAERKKP